MTTHALPSAENRKAVSLTSLHGGNLIAGEVSAGSASFHATDPRTGQLLEPAFVEASPADVATAARTAAEAFAVLHKTEDQERSAFLHTLADEIDGLREVIVERARLETGKPAEPLAAELDRCVRICRSFAQLLLAGDWRGVRVDPGTAAHPDMRRTSVPIGSVAVFGASNIVLMGSACGTDVIAALAAGCPVIVKGHPAHPGTSELLATAVASAIARHDAIPAGSYALLQGSATELSIEVVSRPEVRAVAFTGSLRGGRAIFDAAARRPDPIPVFAEMGSLNPVFVLPGAAEQEGETLAKLLGASVTRHAGQLCTKPGAVFLPDNEPGRTVAKLAAEEIGRFEPAPLLHEGVLRDFRTQVATMAATSGVTQLTTATGATDPRHVPGSAFRCSAETFLAHEALRHEVFGPTALFVMYGESTDLTRLATAFTGELTATIWSTEEELRGSAGLIDALRLRVGRLLWNAMPTGTPDVAAMHHGGPYPAATNPQHTSIGPTTIAKFLRPVVYQNFPPSALPAELR